MYLKLTNLFSCTVDFTTMFSGNETMVTKCLNCQSESLSQQKFYDLSLHFPDEPNTQKSVELVEMIESCLKPVELRGDNQFHCDKCGKYECSLVYASDFS